MINNPNGTVGWGLSRNEWEICGDSKPRGSPATYFADYIAQKFDTSIP